MKIVEVTEHADGDAFFAGPDVDAAWDEARNPMSRRTITYMHPQDFLNVAEPGYDSDKEARVAGYLEAGKPFPMLPSLSIDSKTGRVIGHEGRHRARALLQRGVTQMPVLVLASMHRWGRPEGELPGQLEPQSRGAGSPIATPQSAVFPRK